MKTSEALRKIYRDLQDASGYPDKTVEDSSLAFAYGLAIGTLGAMVVEWERREREYEQKARKES